MVAWPIARRFGKYLDVLEMKIWNKNLKWKIWKLKRPPGFLAAMTIPPGRLIFSSEIESRYSNGRFSRCKLKSNDHPSDKKTFLYKWSDVINHAGGTVKSVELLMRLYCLYTNWWTLILLYHKSGRILHFYTDAI